MTERLRGEAYTGKGYGTLRYRLFVRARKRIESSIRRGYFCEAIAICESVIGDRLESRLSYLSKKNIGFRNLGHLIINLKKVETDQEIVEILADLDIWRDSRNRALHELVKVEAEMPHMSWNDRMTSLHADAERGYDLLKCLYNRVADLNPLHTDRVFERCRREWSRSENRGRQKLKDAE